MSGDLTDEQRLRIQMNRQRALAKQRSQQQSAGTNSAAIQHPRAVPPDNQTVRGNHNTEFDRCQSKPSRESFGDSKIDWNAVINDMDKILAPSQSNSNIQRSNIPVSGDFTISYDKDETRKRKLSDVKTSMTKQSAADQKARIEGTRLKAIERKLQGDTTQSKTPLLHSSSSKVNPQTNEQNFPLTDEQRARIEFNRLKALEKKNLENCTTQQLLSNLRDNTPLTTAEHTKKVTSLTEEQRSRIEANRRQALQKKHCKQSQSIDIPTNRRTTNNAFVSETLQTSAEEEQQEFNLTQQENSTHPKSKQKLHNNASKAIKLADELQYEESRCMPINDGHLEVLIENAELDKPLKNGWKLFDHQKEGVLRALKMRRLILAFDMGLGKTIIGCVWAKAFKKSFHHVTIFVVAPISLHQEWQKTADEATGLNVHMATKAKKKKRKKGGNDEADNDSSSSASEMYILSWSNVSAYKKITAEVSNYVVICDEAHNMQSMNAERTKEILHLVFPKRCLGVLLLTGTPMKNGRPSNLFPLLKAVKHPLADNQRRYEFYFCNGQQKNFAYGTVWDATGSTNLEMLHAHTGSHIFRKTKEECMKEELPPKKREPHRIAVSSRFELRYLHALKDLAKAYELSKSTGREGNGDDILAPFNALRLINSHAKVDGVVALANQIVSEESSLVIFTAFVEVAKLVYQKLYDMGWNGEVLTGETAAHKRQAMVENFQEGISPVFVCTFGAGGVGLTLTAACTVILVDRPWTPGEVVQAEDRVRRIGQKRPVRSIWIKAFPIDDQIDELLYHKEMKSNVAVDGRENVRNHGCSAPKISISQLVKSVLANSGDHP
mmetsp:Transcript_19710/g.41386  ORF Transcript_19710/g.41386 Transcript_19710/m.41386 type:complete len:835 (-) Transcript_19710:1294-3798(-)